MKALVTTLALSAGIGLSALIVGLQRDPLLLTSADRSPPVELVAPRVIPVTVLASEPEPASAVLTLEEVEVRATRTRVRPRPPKEPEPELVIPEIVTAPCVDGEYRELEPGRGVYLMCPKAD